MVASSAVVQQLQQLFERCSSIEEFPHSFDDTLVDNLIDRINLSDPAVGEFVRSRFSSVDFDSASSILVSLLLRLYGKYCQCLTCDDVSVADQLARTEVLLEQKRPAKVLSDLFTMYTTCHRFRQQLEWEDVIFWSVSHLSSEELSIFVRRKIEDFLCMTSESDIEKLVTTSVAELFCCTDSTHVLNGTARILQHFADHLSTEQICLIIETVQRSGVVGETVYQLVARVRPDMRLEDDLAPSKWRNETSRCHTIMKVVQTSPKRTDVSELASSVLLSPCVKLGAFVTFMDFLNDTELQSYLPGMCRILTDRRRAPLTDLQETIIKLSSRLSVSDFAKESPCLVEAICGNAKGTDYLNEPAMAEIRDKLALEITKAVSHSDWEVRDTVVEIGAAVPCFRPLLGPLPPLVQFDPSPYVRAAALRCMVLDAQYHQDELPQLCENVVLLDADAEPRLVATKYLHSTLSTNIRHVFRILPKAIEDTDDEVRRLMIEMCSTLLVVEEYAEDTVKELQQWTEDAEIGAAVRAVLGEPPAERPDPVEHVLNDMMNALRIHFEDTIDCY
ncbi:hypothetical protein Q1695_010957 [Nippostrongylus brasiliensis]|nr:hypothetical protein Q1695_010957 [Nippostrongylus brasiliensis]